MGITSKFDALDSLKILGDLGFLTGAEKSAALASFATVEIAAADAINASAMGRKVPYTTFVDGSESRNFAAVRPDGTIVAEWELGVELVRWIYDALQNKAPVLKGDYKKSITIFADESAVSSPEACSGAEQVVIMSTVPYARKLEGVSGKKHMSSQAPDGVFQVIAAMAKKRFGNQAKISYTFRNLDGMTSTLEGWATRRRAKIARKIGRVKAQRQFNKDTRNPAILIMFK